MVRHRKRPPDLARLRRLAARTHRRDEARERADARRLAIPKVLAWADAHQERTGRWPTCESGPVADAPADTWARINWAMSEGYRGFRPGGSLARFLKKHRNARNLSGLPRLAIPQILDWADSYHRKTGKWPTRRGCGETLEPPYEKWSAIDAALSNGCRGLRGGSSLAGLLWEQRGVYSMRHMPRLRIKQILAWADAHHRQTGHWPDAGPKSGPVLDDPRERWTAINACLRVGLRGLPGGDTLAGVLFRYRGVESNWSRPPLTVSQILGWACAHRRRTGRWPQAADGPIRGAPGETWMKVHQALNVGQRGLPGGGDTLARLLNRRYGVPIAGAPPKLKTRPMLAWADAYHARTGMWPRIHSGPIPESVSDTWFRVDVALRMGLRGWPGGSSLHKFLVQHGRGNVSTHARAGGRGTHVRWLSKTPLNPVQILAWADEHYRRTGRWPNQNSGEIPGSGRMRWKGVDQSLRKGLRGLPGNSSLPDLLARHRGVPRQIRRRRSG